MPLTSRKFMLNKLIPFRTCTALFLFVFAFSSCVRDSQLENYPTVSFSSEVQPIISANCTQSGCHGPNGGEAFSLQTYEEIVAHVSPGNGRKSSIYRAITGRSLEGFMPPSPSSPLTEDQIRSIFVWIEQGAPNN